MTYIDRPRVLNADTLEIRRLKADLLVYYKIFHKLDDLEELNFFVRNNSNTRGHDFIITKQLFKSNVCMIFFGNRSVSVWNDLLIEWVSCDSVIGFKSRLKRYDPSKYCTRFG